MGTPAFHPGFGNGNKKADRSPETVRNKTFHSLPTGETMPGIKFADNAAHLVEPYEETL